jgi:hypothetical protein
MKFRLVESRSLGRANPVAHVREFVSEHPFDAR